MVIDGVLCRTGSAGVELEDEGRHGSTGTTSGGDPGVKNDFEGWIACLLSVAVVRSSDSATALQTENKGNK